MPDQSHFGLWRVGVVGTSHNLVPGASIMCEALGECLARQPTVLLVHGGLKRRSQADPGTLSADWHFVQGARRVQGHRERIETVLPEGDSQTPTLSRKPRAEGMDDAGAEMFIEGALRRIKGRTREARRFGFVSSLDAIVAVGGGYGTRQQLTLASAIEKPMLPVPCFGGAARDFWNEHLPVLTSQLGLSEKTARDWEQEPAADQFKSRAEAMLAAVLAKLPKRAFIIMPYATEHDTLYEFVIEPAVKASRDEINRLDRRQMAGDVNKQIKEGIESSDYCIVVLDQWRPNVMFELGYAHAHDKPLILLLRQGQAQNQEVPFDISGMKRIEYVRPGKDTLEQLKEAVRQVVRRSTV